MKASDIIERLRSRADTSLRQAAVRAGIPADSVLGVEEAVLEDLAGRIGTDHALALELWDSGLYEARLLALRVANPARVSEALAEDWVEALDSPAMTDLACLHLFRRLERAWRLAGEWQEREEELVKRTGFALLAALAVYDLDAEDDAFRAFFPAIELEASDRRAGVREAVARALRDMGLRSRDLYDQALEVARGLREGSEGEAAEVGREVLGELESESVRARMSGED